jgi:hypothetical protein
VSTSSNGSWGRVILPGLPNNRTGWITLAGRQIRHTTWWVRATLSTHRLVLLNGNTMVAAFPVGVGAPASPTPTGRFNVTDLVSTGDPAGPFGWYAFGLSAHQPNLPAGWTGGDQVAIHGTNIPSSIGGNESAGCLHVTASALGVLKAHVILGTPVVIQASPPSKTAAPHHRVAPRRHKQAAPPPRVTAGAQTAGRQRPGARVAPGTARAGIVSGAPVVRTAGRLTVTPPAAGSASPSGAAASAAGRSGRQRSPPP